ncbi:MAG: choice-of-anchor A family protein [Clostridia bacterium]|nr:choice-of-anchor A family protein [Clostridia bacterium]
MQKKKISYIFLIILIILSILLVYIRLFAKAEPTPNIPNSVQMITDENQKAKLLGITSEKAKEKNFLGLAGEFSLFTKDNIILDEGDSEGKIATGGTVNARTTYKYHAGTEIYNNDLAKIVASKGIHNLELCSTRHYKVNTDSYGFTNKYDDNKKIAVVSSNSSDMNWGEFTEEELNQVKVSNLIDFDSEFEWLQNKSNSLVNATSKGEVIHGTIMFGNEQNIISTETHNAIILKGNSDINIFDLTVEEFNTLFDYQSSNLQVKSYKNNNMIFDVPKDSKVIINIIGEGTVKLYSKEQGNNIAKAIMYTVAEEEEIASNSVITSPSTLFSLGGTYYYAHNGTDFMRDAHGNVKTYKLEYNKEIRNTFNTKLAKNLIYNIPQATEVELYDNIVGSILAPNAQVKTIGDDKGFFYGTIASKSYVGKSQFRTDKIYEISISKIFNGELPTDGADMVIKNEYGQDVYHWTATDNTVRTVELPEGTYTLEEARVPEKYGNNVKVNFIVEGIKTAPYYKVTNAKTTKKLIKKSQSLGSGDAAKNKIRFLQNLKSSISSLNGGIVRELEFKINTNITDELYYTVASNGYGLFGNDYSGSYQGAQRFNWKIDWIEYKKWTNVKKGISVHVPGDTTTMYNNDTRTSINTPVPNTGMRIHFYVIDETKPTGAREVTDEVEITDITAIWYETTDNVVKSYEIPNNIQYRRNYRIKCLQLSKRNINRYYKKG